MKRFASLSFLRAYLRSAGPKKTTAKVPTFVVGRRCSSTPLSPSASMETFSPVFFGPPLLKHAFAAAILLGISFGCARNPDISKVSGEVTVRIPWQQPGTHDYKLQNVTISGLSALNQVSGQYADFYQSPGIQNSRLTGVRPTARFVNSHGVYVPEDDQSEQMAVIYAHMQQLKILDNAVGAQDLNPDPRDVGLAVRYTNPAIGSDANNALYEGTTDSMLIVPYSMADLPIAVNAGILGHEHFHSLYYKLVEKKVFGANEIVHGADILSALGLAAAATAEATPVNSDSDPDSTAVYLQNFSRGLNEGLADFWGWVYTGDPDFIAASIPGEKNYRSLNMSESVGGIRYVTAQIWQGYVKTALAQMSGNADEAINGYTPPGCEGGRLVYCLGSYYARNLKSFTDVVQADRNLNEVQARQEVAKAIVRALPQLADAYLNLTAGQYYEPVKFYQLLETSMANLQPKEQQFLQNIYQPILNAPTKKTVAAAVVRPSPAAAP